MQTPPPRAPRIAVITPYCGEPLELLAQCHESVRAQQVQADHFMVADGAPNDEVARWRVRHVVLPTPHRDAGATPRGIGSMLADVEGYDFIAYLDADNWYHPGHLQSLLELHGRTGAPVCTSFRTFHRPDGSRLEITEPTEDQLQHVDSSCFLVHRAAFEVMPLWTRMPRELWILSDRVFLAALRFRRFGVVSTGQRTVAYRTLHEAHYTTAGLALPVGYKRADAIRPAVDWLSTREGVAACVERLGFWPLVYA